MNEVITIGLDLAKSVFQVHGVDASGKPVIRRQLSRRQVLAFFKKLPPCLAKSGSSNHLRTTSACHPTSDVAAVGRESPKLTHSGTFHPRKNERISSRLSESFASTQSPNLASVFASQSASQLTSWPVSGKFS